jgi:hypothetical protein
MQTPNEALSPQTPKHFHSVQFYKDSDGLCEIVGGFLATGLTQGDPALIIATPQHRSQIIACLQARGFDTDALKRSGELTTLDAGGALALFLADCDPNPASFRYSIGGIIQQICEKRPGTVLRAYGEMVDMLWKDGREVAAIRVETLWNELANSHAFNLLCGYSMGHFYKDSALAAIKAQHSHLTSDAGEHAPL